MKTEEIIKTERKKRNLTQEELANELFVSRQLVSKWENGRGYPDLEQLIKLSDLFEISLDELMRGDRQMTKKLNMRIHRRKLLTGIAIMLAGIIFILSYNLWSQELISYTKDEITVEDIETKKVSNKTVIDKESGKEIDLPSDFDYKIKLKSNKKFSKFRNVYLFSALGDDENVYVVLQGQKTIFSDQKSNETILNIISKTTAIENSVTMDIPDRTIKNKNIRVINDPSVTEDLKRNSWLLVDKKDLQ